MAKIYTFSEHSLSVSGEKDTLFELVEFYERVMRETGIELSNTWSDLIYKIKLDFDEEFFLRRFPTMSNNILKQLYWGKLVPWEFRPDDSELTELSGNIDADITALKSNLSAEEREILERLLSNLSALESKQICQGYVNGFKHGSLMMLEVLSPDKQP